MSLASGTLIVAMALVIAAVAARVLAWTLPAADAWARIAREHQVPLASWALAVLALHAIALAAGGGGAGAWALTAVLAIAAAALHQVPAEEAEEEEPARWAAGEPAPRHAAMTRRGDELTVPLAPPPAGAVPVPGPPPQPPRRTLWSEPESADSSARSGLWSP